jgi:hypothetical protein
MKDNVQDIFLTYANHSLKENPEVFYEILDKFKSLSNIRIDEEQEKFLRDIIKYFVIFVKLDDLEAASEFYIEESEKIARVKLEWLGYEERLRELFSREVKIAFEAVYAYRGGYCEAGSCIKNLNAVYAFDARLLEGTNRLKCYECDQLFFRKLLTGIAQGKEYSEIPEEFKQEDGTWIEGTGNLFQSFLTNAHSFLEKRPTVVTEQSESPFKEELEEIYYYHSRELPKLHDAESPKDLSDYFAFTRTFLWEIVAYSLAEYLVNNDRRYLRQCQCGTFFTDGRLDKEFCSRRCYDRWYHKRDMQRRRDPESQKFDLKYKLREFG